jgi:cobalt-zinc-cadmium resistance protein CzcA
MQTQRFFSQLFARPLLWWMAYAALLAWSLFATWSIPTEVLPRFSYPQISVIAHDPGASAAEMETLVVRPLEGELLALADVVNLRSTMGQGTAQLMARFRRGTNPQVDLQAVYGAIDRARASLPASVAPYAEIMGNAINEVADYAVSIPSAVPPWQVQRAITTRILPALRALPGVQRVEIFGSGEESLWVQPDLAALRQHGVGIDAIATALGSQVVLGPTGRLVLGHQDVLMETRSLPLTAQAVSDIPVSTPQGPVPLRVLARVVRRAQPIHYALELDARPSIALIVFKQPGASTVPVTGAVARTLNDLQNQLPAGVHWQRIYDQGHIVSLIRSDLGRNLLVGGALAIAILFWILSAYPGVWVLAVSIPIALLLGIGGLYSLGHTLNLLTFGALTVAIGLLADDSIIVIEAIFHRWETGSGRVEGVWQGVKDIAAPDISGTLTTVATYLPLIAVTGLAGLFFVPFALAMSLVLLSSLVVSLTLIPLVAKTLASKNSAVKHRTTTDTGPKRLFRQSGARFLEQLRRINGHILDWTIVHPRLSLLGAILLLVISLAAVMLVPANLLPLPNEGVLLDSFTLPPGTSLQQTRAAAAKISAKLREDPAVAHTLARIGSAGTTAYTERSFAGELQLKLKPGVSTSSLDALSAHLARMANTVGVQQSFNTPTLERFGESLSGLPQPFVIELYGDHLPTLRRLSKQVVDQLRNVPGLSDIFNNDAYPVAQLRISPRVSAMRAYGLTPEALFRQLRPALRGDVIAQVPDGNYHLNLYLRLAQAEQLSITQLGRILIRTQQGWTPLRLLAQLKLDVVPNQIRHIDGARALDILATPTGSTGATIKAARQALSNLAFPPGYRVGFTGLDVELEHAAIMLGIAAFVSLLLMLGILMSHFGGIKRALILLLQVPLAFTGGALALALSGVGLNAIALVGFLTLIGISLNHGIVLLHRARQAEQEGLPLEAAVRKAVKIRFRPIVLTTLTAVFGMLPTALGWGIGAAPEQGLAVVILGGVLWSSLLSTNLLPALYIHWHRKNHSQNHHTE